MIDLANLTSSSSPSVVSNNSFHLYHAKNGFYIIIWLTWFHCYVSNLRKSDNWPCSLWTHAQYFFLERPKTMPWPILVYKTIDIDQKKLRVQKSGTRSFKMKSVFIWYNWLVKLKVAFVSRTNDNGHGFIKRVSKRTRKKTTAYAKCWSC